MEKMWNLCKTMSTIRAQEMSVRHPNCSTRGFSVTELLVVTAIVAIVLAVAIPSFSNMMQKNRLSSASSAMQVSLSLARSEAIKHGIDASVTVAANGSAGAWTSGWTVFVDKTATANGAVAPTADSATVTRLEIAPAPSGPVSVGQSGSLNYFIYNGQGRLVDVNGGPGNRSFWFYDGTSDKYCLVISVGGRVRTAIVASAAACPSS